MKTISKCPVCESEDLEQEFVTKSFGAGLGGSRRIGGTSYSSPSILDGCTCNNCGVHIKFDKKGECPNCNGTGQFVVHQFVSGFKQGYSMSHKCSTCGGTGII